MFGFCSLREANDKQLFISPTGTAFAISNDLVFTALHNCDHEDEHFQDSHYGLIRNYFHDHVDFEDIIYVTCVAHDVEEDWAIFKIANETNRFSRYIPICPSNELPPIRSSISIIDFPIGRRHGTSKLTVHVHHGWIWHYEMKSNSDFVFPAEVPVTKRKRNNTEDSNLEQVVCVEGGRVSGSCGGPYIFYAGKAIAYHFETVNDNPNSNSEEFNSVVSGNTSVSRGYVLCRLKKFKKWYFDTLEIQL